MTKEQRMQPSGGADGLGEDILAWLARATRAAFVITPHDAMLMATNSLGAKALGFETEFDGAIPLDSAMPAIMDLRRAAMRGLPGEAGKTMTLVFWTPDGVARLACRVRLSGEAGPRRLALIAVEPVTEKHAEVPVSPASKQPAPDHDNAAIDAPPPAASPPNQPPLAVAAKSVSRERLPEPSTMPQSTPQPRAPAERNTARTVAAATSMPPVVSAPPLTPPPPPAPRSDDETLKAIARQILAGRKAMSQPSANREPAEPTAVPRETHTAASPKPASSHASSLEPGAEQPLQPAPPSAHKTHGEQSTATGAPHAEPAVQAAAARTGPPTIPRKSDATQPAAPASPAVQHRQREAGKHTAGKSAVSAASPLAAPPPAAPHANTATASQDNRHKPLSTERRNLLRRLAHELKTPISAIASAAEIMKDERFGAIGDARYLRYARDIHASAHHALQVIERMLGRSVSGDTKTPELAFTDLDVNAILTAVVSSLEIMATTAGISLKTELAPRLPRVVADATSVRQILLNTLTNALKFAPRGSTVAVTSRIETGGPLTITIADTGPGMSSDEIARITSGAADTNGGEGQERPGGGYGIGLPLSMKLAAVNGATLSIESQPGVGTRVTLAFPGGRQIPI